ncbi:MAG: hypothetical protein GF419_04990 [Ignavibacteriales bacterium]|nr:hypothetical protein [Ignavibacteriales bacterium]
MNRSVGTIIVVLVASLLAAAQTKDYSVVPLNIGVFSPADAAHLYNPGGEPYHVMGVQIAALYGEAHLLTGVDVSGLQSTWREDARGITVCGLRSVVEGDVSGFQTAGLVNQTGGSVGGFQTGGIYNAAGGDVTGFQTGGVYNGVGGDVSGVQVGGVFNDVNGSFKGVQVGGFYNEIDGEFQGVQLGAVNRVANATAAVQVGVVNVNDEFDGLPVAVVTHVKDAPSHWELSIDASQFIDVAYRSGSKRVYNYFALGVRADSYFRWSFSYGLGYRFPGKKLSIDVGARSRYVHEDRFFTTELNLLHTVGVLFAYLLSPQLSVTFEPTINLWQSVIHDGKDIAPYTGSPNSYDDVWTRSWFGATLGVRY